jgi:hypothetical protein
LELIGYAGSALVAVSLMMTNIWRLRWINLIGASFFVLYGLALHAPPVAALNAVIVAVDVYYLAQMARRKDYFSLMPVAGAQETLLKNFCDYYQQDIQRFFPGFGLERVVQPRCVFVLRNMLPVGLFVWEARGKDVVDIRLDYVIPEYRDLKNARFLYSAEAVYLKNNGFSIFEVKPASKEFASYVRRLGFSEKDGEPGAFAKPI